MNYIASTYGTGSYDVSGYSPAATTSPGTTAAPSPGSTVSTPTSALSNTGFDIALIVGLAASVLLAAMVIRIWKRPAKPISD